MAPFWLPNHPKSRLGGVLGAMRSRLERDREPYLQVTNSTFNFLHQRSRWLKAPISATPPAPASPPLPAGAWFSKPRACQEGVGGGSEILDFYIVLGETLTRQ